MRNGLRKGIFVVSLCVFVGSLSVIGYKGIYEPLRNRNAVEQVQQIYHTEEDDKDRTSSSQVPEKTAERKRDAFKQLKEGNPDTIGGLSSDAVCKGQSRTLFASWI